MNLTAEQIQANWEEFLGYIDRYIESPRKERLTQFYLDRQDRFILMPAANTTKYHNCFPGGYVEHVNRVVKASLHFAKLWEKFGCDMSTFTIEELVFAALNHDLGKVGDTKNDLYIPGQDEWRRKNLGEVYTYNTQVAFMTVPDRSLFLLQDAGIRVSMNEMLAIRTHDGLYDEANKGYLISRVPESRPKSAIVYILHQADLMASVVELTINPVEQPKSKQFAIAKETTQKNPVTHQQQAKNKALSNVQSEGLKNAMSNFFEA
jgi:hypothetical protein